MLTWMARTVSLPAKVVIHTSRPRDSSSRNSSLALLATLHAPQHIINTHNRWRPRVVGREVRHLNKVPVHCANGIG